MNDLILNSKDNKLEILNSIQDNYSEKFKKFYDYILSTGQDDFSFDNIQGYIDFLNNQNYSGNYKNSLLFALKKRIKEMFKMELDISKRYFLNEKLKEITKFKVNSKAVDRDKLIKKNEVDLLLNKANKRTSLIIQFLIFTGCRVSEMINIQIVDCKELEKYVEIKITGKGNKERIIKVSKELFNQIIQEFKGSVFLFENTKKTKLSRTAVSTQIERLSKKVLNNRDDLFKKSFSAHSFRHFFATDRIKKTGNIKGVSKYLGHSTTAITLDMYTHSELSFEDLLI